MYNKGLSVGLAAIFLTTAAAPSGAAADEVKAIRLLSGHSMVLETPRLTRVGVGDKAIAGVFPIGNSEVLINGKTTGKTSVFTWMGNRHTTYEVTVVDQTLDGIAHMLRASISGPDVHVSSFERSLFIRGTVQTPEQALQIDDLIARVAKVADANKFTVVNAVTVVKPMGDLQSELDAVPGASALHVDRDGTGNLIVSGRVPDRSVAENVLGRVKSHAGTSLATDGKIIDRLSLDMTTQVDVKVYILEVDRTAQSQLGLRLQSGIPVPNQPGVYNLGTPSFPALETTKTGGSVLSALNVGSFVRTTILAPTLDLILNTGHARILSSPDLVTMPGQQATFLVGGQIPIPYASGPSQVAIDYKDFGVQLKVTPTILANGSVQTVVAPEVSDLDFADGVQISGFNIPALKTSRLSTNVVTRSGESIVLGGLMRRLEQKNISKIPLLADIPILGAMFRSTSYQKSETDLVFVMTPEILTR